MAISRRDVLKSLTLGAVAGSVLRVIPAEAAEYAHRMIAAEKAATAAYKPKFFSAHQYETLQALCDAIIPKDARSAGALQAGAPELIDLLTSENSDYQVQFGGGLLWLDSTCDDRFGKVYLDCTPVEQKHILDLISYKRNALSEPGLSNGIEFFRFLRNLTTDAYVTSEVGIKDLGYVGNTFLLEFSGCPPVPE